MDKYQSTTEVDAFLIINIYSEEDGDWHLLYGNRKVSDIADHVAVSDAWFRDFKPRVGGYVVIVPGRIKSFMSAEDFNSTYAIMERTTASEPTPEQVTGLTFKQAFELVRGSYKKMRRPCWDTDMFIICMQDEVGGEMTIPYLYISIAGDKYPWVPQFRHLFATDWEVVK